MKKSFKYVVIVSLLGVFITLFSISAFATEDGGGGGGGCKNTTTIPITITENCKSIWCSSTYSYSGCGWGNGTDCSERKSCSTGQE